MVERLYTGEILWDLENQRFFKEPLRLGDSVWFLPAITLAQFQESNSQEHRFNHLVQDVYELQFKVVQRFPNGNPRTKGFHYLIEVSPGFALFHFNWNQCYRDYLQEGRWYQGFGRLSGEGDPSEENSFVSREVINQVITMGTIEEIMVIHNQRDYIERIPPDVDGVFYGEEPLKSLGYPDDYHRFKANLQGYNPVIKNLQSTADKDFFDILVFSLRLRGRKWGSGDPLKPWLYPL